MIKTDMVPMYIKDDNYYEMFWKLWPVSCLMAQQMKEVSKANKEF